MLSTLAFLAICHQAPKVGSLGSRQWTPDVAKALLTRNTYAIGKTQQPAGVFIIFDGRPLWSYFGAPRRGISTTGMDSTFAAGVDTKLPGAIQFARVGRTATFVEVKIPKKIETTEALVRFLGKTIRTPDTPFYLKGDQLSVGWTLPMLDSNKRIRTMNFGTVGQSLMILGVSRAKAGDIGPLVLVTADWRNAGTLHDVSPISDLRLFVAKR